MQGSTRFSLLSVGCGALLLIAAMSGSAMADQRDVGPATANEPISIGGAAGTGAALAPGDDAAPAIAPPALNDKTAEPKTIAAEGREGSAESDGPSTASGVAAETLGLGTPNHLFSARPAPEESEGQKPSVLDRVDPRRNELTRVLGALGVVFVLIFGFRFVLRRTGASLGSPARPSGVLDVLARYPIARGQTIMLLKVGRRLLLVHQAGTSMSTLSEFTSADEVAGLLSKLEAGARERDAVRFRSLLRTHDKAHDDTEKRELRLAGTAARSGDGAGIEIVDLTRRRRTPANARKRLTA